MMDLKNSRSKARVAVAGLGAIGTSVVRALDRGIEGLTLTAVSAQNAAKHRGWLDQLRSTPEVLPIDKLAEVADIVVECAPSKLVRSIVAPVVKSGKTAIVLSVGALLDNEDLIDIAKENGGPDRGADRRADRARRRDRRGRRHHSFGPAGDAKAAPGARRGAASRRKQDRDRGIDGTAADLRGDGSGGGEGISGQLECRRRVVAGRDRRGSHAGGNLGRSDGHAQHPPHRDRFRFGAFFDVDREHPVGKTRRPAGLPRCR